MRATVSVIAAVAAGLVVLPQSSSADPKPSISDVQHRVDSLFHQAEQASERVNALKVQLSQTSKQLAGLRSDVNQQKVRVVALRNQVGSMVAAQLQSSPMGSSTQFLAASDPTQFLGSLAAVQVYDSRQADLLRSYTASNDELAIRQRQLSSQVAAIAAAKKQMASQQAAIETKASAAKTLLATLKASARQAILQPQTPSRGAVRTAINVPVSGRAKIAVDFAMAQMGEPYVYGAAGPSAWDCSGLTMMAWGAAGVSLPHSAAGQAGYGTPVPISDLQPGDLVFFYSPISHVGIYIGNGNVIDATHPGATVEITPISYMPVTGATRLG
ncbi:MAG: NlpC/P60 family protein [Nocardioidaceae bacterium]